jgi:hypothetical protein
MAELKARHVRGFRRQGAEARAWSERRPSGLRWGAVAALAWLSACFSPEAYTEHLCRTCTSECPEGLTCHDGRCVRVCDASCVGEYHCDESACVLKSGEPQCPARSISSALCVGTANDNDVIAAMSSDGSLDEPWVVLDSQLPEGVVFDPETGKLSGIPTRAEDGSITVRHGEPGSEELSVDLEIIESCVSIDTETISWCRGRDESDPLVASAPGQYEWSVSAGSPPGITAQGDALTGKLDELGSYEVVVELRQSGTLVATKTLELTVIDCGEEPPPDLVTQPLAITGLAALPNACEGIDYAADFEAIGGQGDYRWTLESELAGLALDEASGTLTGKPLASGDFELPVSVEDGVGGRDSITAALHVVSAVEECTVPPVGAVQQPACEMGVAVCPRAPLRIATADLGVVCAGDEFATQLEATGGGGDYRWLLSGTAPNPVPTWLEVGTAGELHGVPGADVIGKHHVTVGVSSTQNDSPVLRTLELEIVSCDALVFITDEPGVDRLFHTDPGSDVVTELSEGVLRAGETVHSFALSADGAHLAFDVTSESAPSRLYWVDLASLDVRQPTFAPALPEDASIIEYRWSIDGNQLAATFRTDNEALLGVSPASGGAGSSVFVTGRYDSGLLWAAERVCYVGPYLPAQSVAVLCHSITPEGIDDQTPVRGIFAQNELRTDLLIGNDEGYLAILGDGVRGQYMVPDAITSSAVHFDSVFSPGLHRAAGPSGGDHSIFEVFTSRGKPIEPTRLAQLDPCDKVDAWSSDERSIACRSGDSLAIHQLGPDGELAGGGIVEDSAGYPEEEFRRLWAPGGQWYAYDTGDDLRVVPLGVSPPRSRLIFPGGAQSLYAGLGTDPSGAHLYYHHGSDLEVVDTRANFLARNVNGGVLLSDPAPCNEAQLDDGPPLWCGAQSTRHFFFPAPAAARVAFVDRQRQLYVTDVVSGTETSSTPRLVHASSVKCTMDSGETACDYFVQWVPRREPR